MLDKIQNHAAERVGRLHAALLALKDDDFLLLSVGNCFLYAETTTSAIELKAAVESGNDLRVKAKALSILITSEIFPDAKIVREALPKQLQKAA
jgi:hypothetical protein